MAEQRKAKSNTALASCCDGDLPANLPDSLDFYDSGLMCRMREIAASGLSPSSALDLIIQLIAEVPAASKEAMDRIKMLDKLLNTARGMMETKLKNEDAAQLAARLDRLELRLEELLMQRSEPDCEVLEVWHAGKRE